MATVAKVANEISLKYGRKGEYYSVVQNGRENKGKIRWVERENEANKQERRPIIYDTQNQPGGIYLSSITLPVQRSRTTPHLEFR